VLVVIELADEGGEHFGRVHRLVMARKIGPVAVVAAAPEEEDLDATRPALIVQGKGVGIRQAFDIDVLMRLDLGHRADPVAVQGRRLELHGVTGFLHAPGHGPLDRAALAGEKATCLVDQFRVSLLAHITDAGRGAAFDLVLQARPGAAVEHRVRAVADQEGALQGCDRPVDRSGRGEGAEIVALAGLRSPVLDDPRPLVIAGDKYMRERLVVPHQHVVARLQPFDQIAFQQ
jgi:hypothetical protein